MKPPEDLTEWAGQYVRLFHNQRSKMARIIEGSNKNMARLSIIGKNEKVRVAWHWVYALNFDESEPPAPEPNLFQKILNFFFLS